MCAPHGVVECNQWVSRTTSRVCQSGAMVFSVHVEVILRPGIADPQGATIERSLPTLGFEGISDVRVGKSIRFDLEAPDDAQARREVEDMCQRFLANPVIEDSIVHLDVVEPANS